MHNLKHYEDVLEKARGHLAIDKSALDDEIMEQPQHFFDVSEASTEVASIRDELSEAVKRVDADLDNHVRATLADKGKVTEAMVAAAIRTHPHHIKAHTEYLTAKLLADKLGALKESYGQRAYMLREMCSLYVSGYFGQTASAVSRDSDLVYDAQRNRLRATRKPLLRKDNAAEKSV